jgi:para-nitrobenzyl esterase
MVWLHGGGFASGSGTTYDGTRLAKRGDVVVVTINHRLNVFGYLYLDEVGGDYFSGSGMAGMLDIELALKWVRDNIAAFGGNPNNVTIFGESGGGAKVSTLLAMPSSKGIIQSGPGLQGVPRDEGTKTSRGLMAKLNISDARKLQKIPVENLIKAISPESEGPRVSGMRLSPVVDGNFLPAHPFDPVAAPTAAGIPIIIGTNKDEALLFLGRDPKRDSLTEAELIERLKPMLGEKTNEVLAVYKASRPNASPFDLLVAIQTESFRLGSIMLAERKAAASNAPVYVPVRF